MIQKISIGVVSLIAIFAAGYGYAVITEEQTPIIPTVEDMRVATSTATTTIAAQ